MRGKDKLGRVKNRSSMHFPIYGLTWFMCRPQRKVERQVKVLIKNLAIFFLFPSKEFLPISFKKFVCLLFHQSPSPPHTVCTVLTVLTEQKLSSWDKANRRQKLGLVWRNRKKISQIIKDYFYLPFFLLIILWCRLTIGLSCTQRGNQSSTVPPLQLHTHPNPILQYFFIRAWYLAYLHLGQEHFKGSNHEISAPGFYAIQA